MKTFDISDVDPAKSIEPLQKLNINYEDDVWIMLRNGATEADKPTILDWPKLFRGYRTTLELNSSYRELLKKFAAGMMAVSRNKCNSQLIFLSMLITKLGIPASETSLPLGV